MLQTEFAFTLPSGYVDAQGGLHRDGIMRLATALDEVAAMQDPRVRANDAYLSIVLLSRVVTRLGTVAEVSPTLIEGLFSSDFAYLQELFVRVNDLGGGGVETECPNCGARFGLDLTEAARSA
jgi:hypothetical protein